MKEILLTGKRNKKRGYIVGKTLIDDEDYDKCKSIKWNLKENYVISRFGYLHRFLMNVNDSNIDVHHKNGNPLDNRKQNLQIMTHENHMKLESSNMSEETKNKISKNHVGMLGKHHTIESRKKLSEATTLYWKRKKSKN